MLGKFFCRLCVVRMKKLFCFNSMRLDTTAPYSSLDQVMFHDIQSRSKLLM